MRLRFFLACFVGVLVASAASYAQDALAEHRIRGLKDLTSVAIVFRETDELKIADQKELASIIRVSLARDVKDLDIIANPEEAGDLLQVTYVLVKNGGGFMELSVARWVKLDDTDLIATTWNAGRVLVGKVTAERLKETLQALLTNFAADYKKANPPQK
jgi:hypothetical protein